MEGKFVPFSRKSYSQKNRFLRNLYLRSSKISIAAEISQIFAQFAILALIELQIDDPDPSPVLIFVYTCASSLLVCHAVILHLAVFYLTPQFDSTMSLRHYDTQELDFLPHKSLFVLWDVIFRFGIHLGFFLFTLSFILLLWIKFLQYDTAIPIWGTIIMTPVLISIFVHGVISYKNDKKERKGEESAEKEEAQLYLKVFAVITCVHCGVYFERYMWRYQLDNIEDFDPPCCSKRHRVFYNVEEERGLEGAIQFL